MAKYKERIKALQMRRKGISIITIARKLDVSKSSVSHWCSDIILTDKQIEKLEKNKGVSFKTGQRIGAETNKKKKLDEISKQFKQANDLINKISLRDLLIIGASLYWAEGAKTESRFIFVNSDPIMVKIIFVFLTKILGVDKTMIHPTLQINFVHKKRVKKVMTFWSKYLNIPLHNFNKPYFVNVVPKKVYENYHEYYGVLRLRVLKSSSLQYKILGFIEVLKKYADVAQVVRAPHS